MKLRYTLDEADYMYAMGVSAREFRRSVGGSTARTGLVFLAAMFGSMAAMVAFDGLRGATYLGIPAGYAVTGYVVLALAMFYAYRRYSTNVATAAMLRVAGPFPLRQMLAIDDDALAIDVAHHHYRIEWASFTAVRRDPAYVVLLARPYVVFLVPMHAFGTPTDIDTFIATIQGKITPSVIA